MTPIILLPGLNGDSRVFSPQIAAFPHAVAVTWPTPLAVETLTDYARRLAASLDVPTDCLIVGVSFGGIVALELARHLPARCCVVIASARDPRGLPSAVRLLRPLAAVASPAVRAR